MNNHCECGKPVTSVEYHKCLDCLDAHLHTERTCVLCGRQFLPYGCTRCDGNPTNVIACPNCHWLLVHEAEQAERERERIKDLSWLTYQEDRDGVTYAHVESVELEPTCYVILEKGMEVS